MTEARIPTQGVQVSALWDHTAEPSAVLLLAHGAGTNMRHPGMAALAQAVARTGCHVLQWAREQPEARGLPLFAGGRSMGGRMASMAAADHGPQTSFAPAGLVFFAYPLHPPGRHDRLRTEHLARISAPMLFLSGTRDSMAEPELMESAIRGLQRAATLYWLQHADHSYKVLKRSGRTFDDVLQEAAEKFTDWRAGMTL